MWFLLLLAAAASDPAVTPHEPSASDVIVAPSPEAGSEVYRRPEVAPYEPPSDFGRRSAEGDAVGRAGRAGGRADAEVDYRSAVEDRRNRAQALMGSLDGLWRVADADGRDLLDLSLTDRGADRPLEGVWLGRTPAGAPRSRAVVVLMRRDGLVRLGLGEGLALELTQGEDGWDVVLEEGQERRAAVLSRITR